MKKRRWVFGLIVAIAIAVLASPFASPHPDGLEKVAEDKGFLEQGYSFLKAPIADYLVPGIKNEGVATGTAGFLGTVLTFGVMFGLGKAIVARKKTNNS